MNFKHNFTWSYDPFGIISNLRIEQKYAPYNHTPRPKIKHFYESGGAAGEYFIGG